MANPTYSLASIRQAADIAQGIENLDGVLSNLSNARSTGAVLLTGNLTLVGADGMPLPATGLGNLLEATLLAMKEQILDSLVARANTQKGTLLTNLDTALPAMCEVTSPGPEAS